LIWSRPVRRFDSYLIDRRFQPIADALAGVVSCYALAGFLAVGGVLAFVALNVCAREYVFAAIVGAAWSWLPLQAHQLDQQPLTNVAPLNRLIGFPIRCTCCFFLLMEAALNCLAPTIIGLLALAGWVLVTTAHYFMACVRHPPKRQEARLPIGAVSDAA
jgi:hypothetical protein